MEIEQGEKVDRAELAVDGWRVADFRANREIGAQKFRWRQARRDYDFERAGEGRCQHREKARADGVVIVFGQRMLMDEKNNRRERKPRPEPGKAGRNEPDRPMSSATPEPMRSRLS